MIYGIINKKSKERALENVQQELFWKIEQATKLMR